MASINHRGEIRAKFFFPRNSPAWDAIQRIKAIMPHRERNDSATMRYLVELGMELHCARHGEPPAPENKLYQPILMKG